ncbi:hypothetical protein [Marinimicrobium alkaliphilum]|uniref:hypothetical protein n=1 Tax=Marinimicrobium alkaliphilum TaxID=2202654 RepID=UPI0013009C26|nr:hypothetical protein [Marinimicrobium alkaliphilum]
MSIRIDPWRGCWGTLLALCWLIAVPASAEPYLAVQTGHACAACHVNPTGGGARNRYGAFFGSQNLPVNAGDIASFDDGQLNALLRIGGDLRFNLSETERDERDVDRGFNTHSGQVYLTVTPENSPVLLHLDQQVTPGGSRMREAFILARVGERHYVKAGNLFLPYGLRLQDDAAFIREASQVNFQNSEQGVEVGLGFGRSLINVALTNGTSSASNNDGRFQAVTRAEYVHDGWRVGAGYMLNDAAAGERHLGNVFGGLRWGDYGLLLEVARLEDQSVLNEEGEPEVAHVGLLEINWRPAQGYNVKFTNEFLDPDTGTADNERRRHSLVFEYTPIAHLQVLSGFRLVDDRGIVSGNGHQVFAQLHFYY